MDNSILLLLENEGAIPNFGDLPEDWKVVHVTSAEAALQALAQSPHHALVSDALHKDGDSTQFTKTVISRFPKMVRIATVDPGTSSGKLPSNGSAHQYVPRQSSSQDVLAAIQRARLLNTWMAPDRVNDLLSKMIHLPSVPSVYLRLQALLKSPDATTDEIGEVLAQDPVATAKMLQLVNSAFFGLGHNITNPGEAVSYLGLERVQALILMIHAFSNYEEDSNPPFKLEALSRHSMVTANLARAIARDATNDRMAAELAFTGGILHDLGKLMLAVNQPQEFAQAIELARSRSIPLYLAEKEVFESTHAELGACVLGIWGLPAEIVEAIAYHHEPQLHFWDRFGPVSAVHIANCMAHELRSSKVLNDLPPAILDTAYLEKLEVEDRVESWRELCRDTMAQVDNS